MGNKEQVIRDYFNSWIENNSSILRSLLDPNVRYNECYGPEYLGIEQILLWFSDWHLKGSVLEWSIRNFIHQDDVVVVEWYFKCEYENNIDGFDGVSIIYFSNEDKITSVKEFQSKAAHYYPYG